MTPVSALAICKASTDFLAGVFEGMNFPSRALFKTWCEIFAAIAKTSFRSVAP